MSLAEQVLEAAKAANVMVATAESCTGGLVCAALTEVPGSSAVVDRGFITYSNDAKLEILGVNPETLEAHGAVSEEVAIEMAEGALKRSKAQIAVSITGIAGPGGSEHKPEGQVCIGLAQDNVPPQVSTLEFGAVGRENVRKKSVGFALMMLLQAAQARI